jgi:hypothetical protein
MVAPEGTIISYATQPGNVALDGNDGNSPYTKALGQTMRQPGFDIFQMFNEVGLAVMQATGNSQQPWLSSSPIKGRFYFAGEPQAPIYNSPVPMAPVVNGPEAPERAWTLAKDTTSQVVLEDFIRHFGDTFYATLARDKLEALKKSQVAGVAPQTPAPPPKPAPAPAERTVAERLCPVVNGNVELLRCYRQAADAGNTEAMFEVGHLYCEPCFLESSSAAAKSPWRPIGIPVNDQEAMRWFRKAADAGNAKAMSYVGMLYNNGRGVPKNSAQAIAWWRKAAALGDKGAQDALKHHGVN